MISQKTEGLMKLLTSKTDELAGRFLSAYEVDQLVRYYALILKWNPRLHLTTVIEPADFFQRHLFESLFLASHLVSGVSEFWDLGSGLGVPGIPLAIARPDMRVSLVESNQRKAVFLTEVADCLGLANVSVVNRRFEALCPLPVSAALSARAVDNMDALLPKILELGRHCRQILLLGGIALVAKTDQSLSDVESEMLKLPGSKARFLINLTRST